MHILSHPDVRCYALHLLALKNFNQAGYLSQRQQEKFCEFYEDFLQLHIPSELHAQLQEFIEN